MTNFIYRHSVTTAWFDLVRDLLLHGEKARDTREVFGYGLCLAPGADWLVASKRRDPSWAWACMEVLWYLSLTDDVRPLLLLAPGYRRFVEEGSDRDAGAYGRRWMHNSGHDHLVDGRCSQLATALDILRKDPTSRQSVITMWDSIDLTANHMNKPCTLSMQFLVRQGELRCQTSMRSNDAWIGFIYDTFAFRVVQRLMADALNVRMGHYNHVVGSMHLYERNFLAAEEAVKENPDHVRFCAANQWQNKLSPEFAAEILYREDENCQDDSPLSQLMRGAIDRDAELLREVAEGARGAGSWFDYLILTAAEGCIEKLDAENSSC